MSRGVGSRMVRGATGFRAVSGGSKPRLDLFAGGTFTRSTEGATIIGPATDGSTAFLQWDGVNVRRIEYDPNLPGGFGLLMEGSRTNWLTNSRNQSAWAAGSSVTTTASQAGPDGALIANRHQVSSGGYCPYLGFGGIASAAVVSAWQRTTTADPSWQFQVGGGATVAGGGASGIVATYTRKELASAAAITAYVPIDGRDQTANGGIAAQAHDIVTDLHQAEAAYFPSSPIRTAGTSVTRGADTLTYAVGQYPEGLRAAGRFTFVPLFSSAEFVSSGALAGILMGTGPGDCCAFGISGGNCELRLAQGGINRHQRTLTFSRYAVLQIEYQFTATTSQITISGAATGNGTFSGAASAIWPSDVLVVGHQGGIYNAFGRFGQYVEVL